jgi:hypothetical protein
VIEMNDPRNAKRSYSKCITFEIIPEIADTINPSKQRDYFFRKDKNVLFEEYIDYLTVGETIADIFIVRITRDELRAEALYDFC